MAGESLRGVDAWLRGMRSCYPASTELALPAAVLCGVLLARAHPLRPVFAATAGALGSGLFADAAMHLTCGARVWTHTLLVHGAGVATLALLGALAGLLLRRRVQGAL
jgi:hypothetical protein